MASSRWATLVLFVASACSAQRTATGPGAATSPTTASPGTSARVADARVREDPRALDSWANGAVFYEVFVRSFQDSNGDGVGDLKGLISRLDYLNDGDPATDDDLGVDALWLMPVFVSPSYHGYDTIDYENIDPEYGTNADFARFLDEAHRRGMKVIVDLMLNHSSDQHPWFVESASSPASPKRDWYVWSKADPGWGQPWNAAGRSWHAKNGFYYYGVFWRGMPDLNFRHPPVREEAKRIATLWLGRGVDGFRLDATRHLIETGPGETGQNDTRETQAFLRELSAHVRERFPRAVLVGENWTETPIIARYYGDTTRVPGGDLLPLNFDFPLAARIIASARQGDAAPVAGKLEELQRAYPPGATWVPFLTNHDMKRVATNLGGDQAKLRVAAAILLTLPGTPFLYYGEELGMENGPGDEDEWKRTPMPWKSGPGGGFTTGRPWRAFAPGHERVHVAAQTDDPASLLSHYRRLIRTRHASHALRRGALRLLTKEGPVLAWVAEHGAERVLVAHNLGPEAQAVVLSVDGERAESLLGARGAALVLEGAAARVTLPPQASGVWRLVHGAAATDAPRGRP